MLTERRRPKKTISATFRIDEDIHDVMQADARTRRVSVNTLVNQLFDFYANSDRFMGELGLVRITAPNFKRFLDAVPQDKLAALGEAAGKDLGKAYMLAKHGEVNLSSVLDYVQAFAHYGGYAMYNETETGGKKVIVLVHGFGMTGSVYIGAYVKPLFESVGCNPSTTLSEESVVIEI